MFKKFLSLALLLSLATSLSSCGSDDDSKPSVNDDEGFDTPQTNEDKRRMKRAEYYGGSQLLDFLGGGKGGDANTVVGGVNAYLWKATLDTISFMPIANADAVSGVIITDWYQDPANPGERIKANIVLTGAELRADGVNVNLFRQVGGKQAPANKALETQLEDKILTRARQLKIDDALL